MFWLRNTKKKLLHTVNSKRPDLVMVGLLTICMQCNFFMLLLLSADFFQNYLFQNTIRVSNHLDPDQG